MRSLALMIGAGLLVGVPLAIAVRGLVELWQMMKPGPETWRDREL